jgi:hypothetical protein
MIDVSPFWKIPKIFTKKKFEKIDNGIRKKYSTHQILDFKNPKQVPDKPIKKFSNFHVIFTPAPTKVGGLLLVLREQTFPIPYNSDVFKLSQFPISPLSYNPLFLKYYCSEL